MFLDLPDPDPSLFCADPDPSVKKQWLLYDFLSWKNDVNVSSQSNKQKNLERKVTFSCHLEGY
jgi:hypothetical protein